MRLALAGCVCLTALSSCGPVSLQQAERECYAQARLAERPRGKVTVGVGSGGARVGGELSISSDYLTGRDPSALFDNCVLRRAGRMPSQPYYSYSGGAA